MSPARMDSACRAPSGLQTSSQNEGVLQKQSSGINSRWRSQIDLSQYNIMAQFKCFIVLILYYIILGLYYKPNK